MADHKYECPHCAQHLKIPDNLFGKTLECPSCKRQFNIPKPTPVTVRATAHPPPIPTQPSQPEGTCPLCGQTKHMHKAKPLYGHMVCKKCYYGFANRRQFAFVLDNVCWQFLLFPVSFALGLMMALSGSSQSDIESTATLMGWLLLGVFFCKDCFAGQSPGKAICGIKVIDKTTGQSGGIGASFKRNLPLLIPFMVFIVAFQLCKGHRTGDGWSNSKVIWKKYANHPVFAVRQTP
jgi:uncharacterized RDD family membrane protein YckC